MLAPTKAAALFALFAFGGCGGAGTSESRPRAAPALPSPRPPPSPEQAEGESTERGLPDACARASAKLSRAERLAASGFVQRANRLLEQAGSLCAAKQSEAREAAARNLDATRALSKGDAEALWAAALAARASDPARARRLASLAVLAHQKQGESVTAWRGLGDVRVLALSHDGAKLLAEGRQGEVLSVDAATLAPKVFFDVPAPADQARRRHFGQAEGAAFSPSGSVAALASGGAIVLYDTTTGARTTKLEWADRPIRSFVFSSDGQSVFAGLEVGIDAEVRRFDVKTGDSLGDYQVKGGRDVTALATSADGKWVAVGSRSAALELVDAKKLTKAKSFGKAGAAPSALAFSPSGDRLAAISSAASLEVWNTATGALVASAQLERAWGSTLLGFSADGSRVRVSGGTWGDVLMEVDAGSGKSLTAKKVPGRGGLLSKDGRVLVVGSEGNGIHVVDTQTGKVTAEAARRRVRLEDVAITDGTLALARELDEGGERSIELLVASVLTDAPRFSRVPGYKATLALSPHGRRVAGSFGGKSVRVFETESGKSLALPDALEWVDVLTFLGPDELRAAGGPFELKVFTARLGQSSWTANLSQKRSGSRSVALGGPYAAVSSDEGLSIIELGTTKVTQLPKEKDYRGSAISADGRVLVTVSGRGTVRRSLPGGSHEKLLSGHCNYGAPDVSADGSVVLVRCSYRELGLLLPSGDVTVPLEANRTLLSPRANVVLTEQDGVIALRGRDLKERARVELGARPGSVLVTSPDGGVELVGDEPGPADRWFCRVGRRAKPFELCEDLMLRDDLLVDALAP